MIFALFSSLCVWAREIFLAGSDPLSFVLQNQMGMKQIRAKTTQNPQGRTNPHTYHNTITQSLTEPPETHKHSNKQSVSQSVHLYLTHYSVCVWEAWVKTVGWLSSVMMDLTTQTQNQWPENLLRSNIPHSVCIILQWKVQIYDFPTCTKSVWKDPEVAEEILPPCHFFPFSFLDYFGWMN